MSGPPVRVRQAQAVVVVRSGPGMRVRQQGQVRVIVPRQGPPGAPGDGVPDPGDLTLIFDNHLI